MLFKEEKAERPADRHKGEKESDRKRQIKQLRSRARQNRD